MEKSDCRQPLKTNFYVAVLLACFALFSGGLIYILWRPIEPVFFQWFDKPGLMHRISLFRHKFVYLNHFLPDWFLFSLPDGLWAFAYSLLISAIWANSASHLRFVWLGTIPLLVFGFEFFQLTGFIPGTFSLQDIAFGTVGLISGYFAGKLILKSK